jgi:hypothetical protein
LRGLGFYLTIAIKINFGIFPISDIGLNFAKWYFFFFGFYGGFGFLPWS